MRWQSPTARLRAHLQSEWAKRYARRAKEERLPAKLQDRAALAEKFGADGVWLLRTVYAPDAPPFLCQLPAVEILPRVWVQNYQQTEQGLNWREAGNIPPWLWTSGRTTC